jgi:hypothetical protein
MKKGSHHSQDTIRKISARLRTAEIREKILAANVGSKRTDKTRQNISLGLRKMWERKHLRESPQITLTKERISYC